LAGPLRFTANDGMLRRGVILRLNRKTGSLQTNGGHLWKVSPGLLRKANN
jgi:hypothetical protein